MRFHHQNESTIFQVLSLAVERFSDLCEEIINLVLVICTGILGTDSVKM